MNSGLRVIDFMHRRFCRLGGHRQWRQDNLSCHQGEKFMVHDRLRRLVCSLSIYKIIRTLQMKETIASVHREAEQPRSPKAAILGGSLPQEVPMASRRTHEDWPETPLQMIPSSPLHQSVGGKTGLITAKEYDYAEAVIGSSGLPHSFMHTLALTRGRDCSGLVGSNAAPMQPAS